MVYGLVSGLSVFDFGNDEFMLIVYNVTWASKKLEPKVPKLDGTLLRST